MTRTVQIIEGRWYLEKFGLHECCDCGLTHKVEWRIDDDGRIFSKWSVQPKETRRTRRASGIKIVKPKRG